jgi:uncharacterized protein YndB with AHSA1/START domain
VGGGSGGGGANGSGNRSGPREIPGAITTVHRYELPLGPETVWSLISDVEHYRSWWPWLRQFEGGGLSVGDEWRCTVQPPVPYLVRFRVVIDHVEPPSQVQAQVFGEVVGAATLTLEPEPYGCVAVLQSSLVPGNTALAVVSRFAAPVARFGHDWVLDSAARQFIAKAIEPALGDAAS